jgi:hypothetical protein
MFLHPIGQLWARQRVKRLVIAGALPKKMRAGVINPTFSLLMGLPNRTGFS